METFLRQGLQAIRENSKSKVIDENKLHITEIERVYNQKVQLSINDRVKLEHMVSLAKPRSSCPRRS